MRRDGGEEMQVFLANVRRPRRQRRDVVEYPDRPPVGADHEVIVLDLDGANAHRRQVEAQPLPGGAAVRRVRQSALAAEVELALLLGVLAYDVEEAEVRVGGEAL